MESSCLIDDPYGNTRSYGSANPSAFSLSCSFVRHNRHFFLRRPIAPFRCGSEGGAPGFNGRRDHAADFRVLLEKLVEIALDQVVELCRHERANRWIPW